MGHGGRADRVRARSQRRRACNRVTAHAPTWSAPMTRPEGASIVAERPDRSAEIAVRPEIRVGTSPVPERAQTKVAIKDLSVFYGEFRAVRDITLDIPQNRVTAMIGPSGVGKSTVLRSINRMTDLVPGARTTGEITLDGTDVL